MEIDNVLDWHNLNNNNDIELVIDAELLPIWLRSPEKAVISSGSMSNVLLAVLLKRVPDSDNILSQNLRAFFEGLFVLLPHLRYLSARDSPLYHWPEFWTREVPLIEDDMFRSLFRMSKLSFAILYSKIADN